MFKEGDYIYTLLTCTTKTMIIRYDSDEEEFELYTSSSSYDYSSFEHVDNIFYIAGMNSNTN
jgi:hypothetical protein